MNKVLVVDDEKHIATLLKRVLTGNGYEVFTAKNGEEALSLATQKQPDLIILDLMMPGISGIEVCRVLKTHKNTSGIPIIVLSALDRLIDKKYVIDAGGDAFLSKPINSSELLTIIDKLQNRNKEK
jgi:DNA-binding response OmpR family regulator